MRDSPFEQWRMKHMRGTAVSRDIMELLALAFAGGRASRKEWVGLTDEEIELIVDKHTTDESGYDIWCDGHGVAKEVETALREKNA